MLAVELFSSVFLSPETGPSPLYHGNKKTFLLKLKVHVEMMFLRHPDRFTGCCMFYCLLGLVFGNECRVEHLIDYIVTDIVVIHLGWQPSSDPVESSVCHDVGDTVTHTVIGTYGSVVMPEYIGEDIGGSATDINSDTMLLFLCTYDLQ